jgi:hypothetical protein
VIGLEKARERRSVDDPFLQKGIGTFESKAFRMTAGGFLPLNQTYVAYFGAFYIAHIEFVL